MKAINLSEPWKIAVKELEKPVPKEGEALIRVISAGICGSDIGRVPRNQQPGILPAHHRP